MYLLLALFAVLSTAGITMLVRAASAAPEAYEDADGFHAVNPGEMVASQEVDLNFENLFFVDTQPSSRPWS